jgi:hypothetical protein
MNLCLGVHKVVLQHTNRITAEQWQHIAGGASPRELNEFPQFSHGVATATRRHRHAVAALRLCRSLESYSGGSRPRQCAFAALRLKN